MGRFSLLAVAAAVAAAATIVAATSPPPSPSPKVMRITKETGEQCISRWFVTGRDEAAGKWIWKDVTTCCPPRMPTKTMIVFQNGKRCVSTWTQCGTKLNNDKNCVRTWCDKTECAEPVCPPKPPVMKTRYVKKDGQRCVKTWKACGKTVKGGVCTWKGCDVLKCNPPCPKPMAKTMKRGTATKSCVSHWWPESLKVDLSSDGMACKWAWKDVEECYCDTGSPKWTKC